MSKWKLIDYAVWSMRYVWTCQWSHTFSHGDIIFIALCSKYSHWKQPHPLIKIFCSNYNLSSYSFEFLTYNDNQVVKMYLLVEKIYCSAWVASHGHANGCMRGNRTTICYHENYKKIASFFIVLYQRSERVRPCDAHRANWEAKGEDPSPYPTYINLKNKKRNIHE